MSRSSLFLSSILAVSLGGLGGCDKPHEHNHDDGETHGEDAHEHGEETHGDTGDLECEEFSVGLSKTGDLVTATFVSADPAPPILGDNVFVLAFTDLSELPLDGLEIVVTPTMPDHGHGTPIEAIVTATGNPGEYSVAPVNLFMKGLWLITFDVTIGDATDQLSFSFCVE